MGRYFRGLLPFAALGIALAASACAPEPYQGTQHVPPFSGDDGGGDGDDGDDGGNDSPPPAPTGVIAIAGDGEVTISWSPVDGATSYKLYWLENEGVSKDTGNRIVEAQSPYLHNDLTNGTNYYYVVTALNQAGESEESEEVSATPFVGAGASCDDPGGCWVTMAPMPTTRYAHGIAEVNGVMYVVSGYDLSNWLTTVEAFDPVTNTWAARSAIPTGRGGPMTAAINGLVYAIGGNRGCTSLLPTVEVYDPVTNDWSTEPNLPVGRAGSSAVHNGKIYVVGGISGCATATNALNSYDPATGAWDTLTPMGTARDGTAVAVISGKIYVFGGADGASVYYDTGEVYDPVTDTWDDLAPMPIAIAGPAVAMNGKMYILGGTIGSGGLTTDMVLEYDPVSDSWTNCGGSCAATTQKLARYPAVEINGRAYLAGGVLDQSNTLTDLVEAYTPPGL
jgi:N-acetylneuraminic acid mutarotase